MEDNLKQTTTSNRNIFTYFALYFTPLFIIVTGISVYLYRNEIRTDRKVVQRYERETADLQRKIIENTFSTIVSDLRVLAEHDAIHTAQNGETNFDTKALTREFMSFSRYKGIYDQIRLLDVTGREIIRINYNDGNPSAVPRDQLQHKGARYYFKDTVELSRNQVFVSPFDLNIEKGSVEIPLKPMIRFGTPVFNRENRKLGIVIVNYLGKNIIRQIDRLSISSPGRTMLLNTAGYWLKGLSRENEWGFMFPGKQSKTFQNRFPEAWKIVSTRPAGQFLNKEGLFTFVSAYPFTKDLKSSNGSPEPYKASTHKMDAGTRKWTIASYISPAVYSTNSRRLLARVLWFDGLLVLLLGIGAGYIAMAKVRKRQADQARLALIADLQEALQNVKTLSGMLPICSNCKKIRDDSGYWNQIETYIESRSKAQFSHGVCPECLEKLYGQEEWYKKDGNQK